MYYIAAMLVFLHVPFEDGFQHIFQSQNVGGCSQGLQHWKDLSHTVEKKKIGGGGKRKKKSSSWSM